MSDYDDDAQVEQLRRWWQENWKALAAGVVLGLGGIFGWEAWKDARDRNAERASEIYEDVKRAMAGKPDRAVELGRTLVAEYPGTPYAAQASLLLAELAARRGEWQDAQARLDWVVRNADDDGLRKIARLRLARVLWQQEQPQEAIALLKIDSEDAFAPLYLELRGDIRLSMGERAAARADFEEAMRLGPAPPAREFLQHKLDELAGVQS